MARNRVTIADVARHAGVSTATVSRMLNGKGAIDPATRSRIEAAVRTLNYTPNPAARQLGSGLSHMVGLVLPDIANPFFPLVARGASDVARQRGYTVVLANSDGDPEIEADAARALLGQRVDGVIVAPAGERTAGLDRLAGGGLPVVLLDRPIAGVDLDCVCADNRGGAALVARHLFELGHRRFGFISGPAGVASAADRRYGFASTAEELGAELRAEWVADGDFQLLSGFRAMQRILSEPVRPSAVACANDLMALGALRALRLAGLRAPEDMAVVGYDDIPMAAMADPALTTVSQPAYRMGAVAMERLLARLAGDDAGRPETTRLPVRLVVRESCGGGRRGQPEWL